MHPPPGHTPDWVVPVSDRDVPSTGQRFLTGRCFALTAACSSDGSHWRIPGRRCSEGGPHWSSRPLALQVSWG